VQPKSKGDWRFLLAGDLLQRIWGKFEKTYHISTVDSSALAKPDASLHNHGKWNVILFNWRFRTAPWVDGYCPHECDGRRDWKANRSYM